MAKQLGGIGGWTERFLAEEPPRSRSLIITIFGDLIAPLVPGVWLSELIALLAPFHVNERLVRTSCFRLTEEGWLESLREGRRSRYSLTDSGLQRVQHAYHRIYDHPPAQWDGHWTMAILHAAGSAVFDRAELKRELGWEGFGPLAPGIFFHPCADLKALREVLDRLRLSESVTVLRAQELAAFSSTPVSKLTRECWSLDSVAGQYRSFLARFQPALPMLRRNTNPQVAYVVQTLLIHSFRRVVLHDPRLPAPLLPASWPGHLAYDLCRDIYGLHLEPRPDTPRRQASRRFKAAAFEQPREAVPRSKPDRQLLNRNRLEAKTISGPSPPQSHSL